MNKPLHCVMLIDDSTHDNFFHSRAIKSNDAESVVITKESAKDALEYLKAKTEPHSDLIFLDINMPGMNGWEFLEAYSLLDKELQSQTVIIMLSTSDNPRDLLKAKTYSVVSEFITKPLTKDMMHEIAGKYFN